MSPRMVVTWVWIVNVLSSLTGGSPYLVVRDVLKSRYMCIQAVTWLSWHRFIFVDMATIWDTNSSRPTWSLNNIFYQSCTHTCFQVNRSFLKINWSVVMSAHSKKTLIFFDSQWRATSRWNEQAILVCYRIHSNRRPCPNRRPPLIIIKLLAHKNRWNRWFFIKNACIWGRIDFGLIIYALSSRLAHAQCAAIRMNTIVIKYWLIIYMLINYGCRDPGIPVLAKTRRPVGHRRIWPLMPDVELRYCRTQWPTYVSELTPKIRQIHQV